MQHLKTAILILLISVYGNIASQTFQDNPANEPDGNFPSKWDLIKGSAEIKTFEGQKVIRFGNKSIITPLMDSKNYLSDTFTLEFDAYFDIVQNSINYQYYNIRFWEGPGDGKETTNLGKVVTFPLNIARHGAILEHNLFNPSPTKESFKEYKPALEGKEAIWRHILIDYNKSALKVSIDGSQILNIPRPKFSPKMISIEGVYIQYGEDFMRAIKSVQLDGINLTNTDSNTTSTSGNDQTDTDNTNTNIQTENYAYALPIGDGNSGQILQTDGNGNVSWVNLPIIESTSNTTETSSATTDTGLNSGLEAIDEGNGIGWRLIGSDPANYGNIGVNAIDLSRSFSSNNLFGATGGNSFAAGLNAQAVGIFSKAIGSYTNAVGTNSSAIGNYANSRGDYSMALGDNIVAQSFKSFALGTYNVISGTANAWIETEPLLVIGNGIDNANRSNALTVLKNGTITAPSFDISEITNAKSLITKEYADANYSGGGSSTGLEAIDEGNGLGWRLIGRNPAYYGNIGQGAMDLSTAVSNSTSYGALGLHTFAVGLSASASGTNSLAMGRNSIASGDHSVALGHTSQSLGNESTAIGFGAVASGFISMAIGKDTKAEAYMSTAMGKYNIGGGSPFDWIETDPIFEIGNGWANPSNALTILKNGTITAPSFDLSEIIDPKSLITKEYADAKYSGGSSSPNSGLEAMDEGNGIGWRLKGRDPNNYGNIGLNAVDLSLSNGTSTSHGAKGENSISLGIRTLASGTASTAMGLSTIALGDYSIAMGENTKALSAYSFASGLNTEASGNGAMAMGLGASATNANSIAIGVNTLASGLKSIAIGNNIKSVGESSTAMGTNTIASGKYSTVMGNSTKASGENSTAIGYQTIASGDYSLSIGNSTRAQSYNSTALGTYNIGRGDSNEWRNIDPLFEIGNGSDDSNRANALTVLKNGNIGIGTHLPQVKLHVMNGTDASLGTGGYMIIGDKQDENLVFDNNEIMARKNVQPSTLYLQHNGGDVFVGGKVVHSSDQRLKQDIKNLSYGLDEIMQLRPVSYNWKSNPEASQKSIGLIAQEVQPILKELITTNTEHNNTLGINYTELIPILIKAIQEQQSIINNQNKKIDDLTADSNSKDIALSALNSRIHQIEAMLKKEKLCN